PDGQGRPQAPHIMVSVFTRGLVKHVATRMYFPEDATANGADAVLALVPAHRRGTLIATADGQNRYRWDVVLQGPGETVFFDI
ncbi:MAG: protocatechuate 3,4-dioxygenase subunit alpha, partial [Cupriavidus sp.]|nr:protocatechuate 3,4-dioxygenase subunit alpha [Cupriavidus sp.]